jgi:ferredoxin-NADP reductase
MAAAFSVYDVMPFSFLQLFYSFLFLQFVCWLVNLVFSLSFRVPVNSESVYITAAILCLIVTPPATMSGYISLFWIAAIAMASKFILNIKRKHIFNPAAVSVVIGFYLLNTGASWWVGNQYLFALSLICGLLIARKARRLTMVFSFLLATLVLTSGFAMYLGLDLGALAKALFLSSPIIFFATVMLTEPSTSPPTKKLQIIYAVVVGLLFSPFTHFGTFYFTPELALIAGNVFAYIVSPKYRLMLKLDKQVVLSKNISDFVFQLDNPIDFRPGQYMEWTLGHKNADGRGNRRYFTIASSPTEKELRIGVRFYDPSSSYKKALSEMKMGDKVVAAQIMGDFTLPQDKSEKSAFIAGGIGITPFRSMIKYLIDKNDKRDIVALYSNKTADEIVYKDIFDQAQQLLGIKTIYTLTGQIENWSGEVGRISPDMIKKHIPDYDGRTFYVSGTHQMVTGMKKLLLSMGIPKKQIKSDFFPGFV